MANKNPRILFAGGGTGGHIYPLLAVIEEIKKIVAIQHSDVELHYCGSAESLTPLLVKAGVQVHSLGTAKLRRYASGGFANILDAIKFPFIILQALFKLYWLMPEVIFSKGGTGALPIIIAGWFYRIPIIIHESDAVPGLTNLSSAFFAFRIAVGTEAALKSFNPQKTAFLGNPIRSNFLQDIPQKDLAKQQLGFVTTEPLIVIIAGSQGSQSLNEFIVTNLQALLEETQIFHITGNNNYAEIEAVTRAILTDMPVKAGLKHTYQTIPYAEENLKTIYAAADLIISRAGAGTLNEVAALGKPSILIPLPQAANDHQRANAYAFAKNGAALVIEQENLLPGIFISQIKNILHTPGLLNQMSIAAQNNFRPNAANVLAEELLAVAKIVATQ